jgi:NodT family efflux transporter outer membrane factor (OMF) lipoprotein
MADYENALVSLTAEVARTYAMVRTFEVLIEQGLRNVKLQEEGLRIAETRYRSGSSSELDVAQATTLLESTRASIPQLETGLIQAKNALCTLLGQPAGAVQAFLQGSSGIPTAPAKVSVIVPAELLQRRPDVRSAEFLAAAQCARIGMAKSELYPRIVLFGEIGTQAGSNTGVPSGTIFTPSSFFYAIGPRFVWPLFTYGRATNNVRVQDARLQQLLVNYEHTVIKAAQEVEDGLIGYLKAQEAIASALNATKGAQRSAELALIQYREGAVDYQRVLDAQRSFLREENALAQARSTVVTTLILLYKALGGGWELRRGQPVVPDSTRVQMQQRTNWGNLLSKPLPPQGSDASKPKDR